MTTSSSRWWQQPICIALVTSLFGSIVGSGITQYTVWSLQQDSVRAHEQQLRWEQAARQARSDFAISLGRLVYAQDQLVRSHEVRIPTDEYSRAVEEFNQGDKEWLVAQDLLRDKLWSTFPGVDVKNEWFDLIKELEQADRTLDSLDEYNPTSSRPEHPKLASDGRKAVEVARQRLQSFQKLLDDYVRAVTQHRREVPSTFF